MKISVLTYFDATYAPLADIALPILKRYCDKHGYGLHVSAYHSDPARLETYGDRGKIAMYNQHCETHDILMFLDIDALVMNSDIRIEERLGDRPFLWCWDVNGPNSAFWIARCTQEVHLALNYVKNAAPTAGGLIPRHNLGPPYTVTLQMEPAGTSDQTMMRSLMTIPPFSNVFRHCVSGKQGGLTYPYGEYGWERYRSVGDYAAGDWILSFPSIPLERRIELMRTWSEQAI